MDQKTIRLFNSGRPGSEFCFYFFPLKNKRIYSRTKVSGTYYSATYLQPEGKDLQPEIEKLFKEFDLSLSTYNPNSIISK